MKQLYQVLTNASNLKLLCGNDLGYSFPLKYPKSDDPKKLKIKTTSTLREIMMETPNKRIRSHDPRFDNKHPIELALENLQSKGLTNDQIYKIIKNKASVNSKKIKGPLSYLSNFITDEHRAVIAGKLKEVSIGKYGQFIRNGSVF
jgi:hypothetical protein